MPTLFLHIGAFKTGSSYIQSCLHMSRDKLASHGLIYPIGTEEKNLKTYSWTSGNAGALFIDDRMIKKTFDTELIRKSKGLILSSEALLVHLANENVLDRITESIHRYGFNNISILIFVRDPIHLGVSMWLQMIKRHGETDRLDDYLIKSRIIQEHMKMTAEILEFFSCKNGYTINIFNYASIKNDIIQSVCDWLNVGRKEIQTPDHEKVNRSLDMGETIMQIEINRIFGEHGKFLGQALTEKITDIPITKPTPSMELQESIWEEIKPWVERINRFLPENQGLTFDKISPIEDIKSYHFTEEQIKIIANTLGGEIKRIWDSETKAMRTMRRLRISLFNKNN